MYVYVNLVEGNWRQFATESMAHLVPNCVPIKDSSSQTGKFPKA